ncbi:aldehyde dehydrogenase family protein, partial [Bacillus mycoides]|uniref:aldehyde dehydrogenase family protein n=1 Tax=Bacillus mycoides TaxID=1405 RepID=UPI003CC7FBD2
MTPSNFPIPIPPSKIPPPLIYPNTLLIKPPQITPKSLYHLINPFHQPPIPPPLINSLFPKPSLLPTQLTQN